MFTLNLELQRATNWTSKCEMTEENLSALQMLTSRWAASVTMMKFLQVRGASAGNDEDKSNKGENWSCDG